MPPKKNINQMNYSPLPNPILARIRSIDFNFIYTNIDESTNYFDLFTYPLRNKKTNERSK